MAVNFAMKPMGIMRYYTAKVSLGLFAGWYYFCLFPIFPSLAFLTYLGSLPAGATLGYLAYLTVCPLSYKPWPAFQYSWLLKLWREYFDFSFDCSSIMNGKMKDGENYMLCDMPHGIHPMGPFLSTSITREIMPGYDMLPVGADAIFLFPVMRQIFSWIGTRPAHRKNITKIFEMGQRCVVLPGGIAEMFIVNDKTEALYLTKRHSTVKAAIQEGAHLVPTFFFGNSRLFDPIAGLGKDSWLARFSRKMRTSIVLFNPFPHRRPLRMVTGDIIEVKKNPNPSDEEVNEVLQKLIAGVKKVYEEKKPEWENRPLEIL
jgi:2-acylglycerol O-acyltransferase 2